MKKLENKVVFITGGNSGIGKAAALVAAREGAIIVVADLPGKDHDQTLNEIKNLGAKCLFAPINVSNVSSVKEAISLTVEKFGRLDVAFNNAGIAGKYSGIHDMPEEEWDKIIAINLTGQFYCVKYELQQFLKQGAGVL
ncbi:SDR family NAD(P)-dependent oxidoreductase [Maribacter sp. ACAM166]|nr:SDR family NAD(P)-dependent oxidoreductase [Maribacter sp. ACAM166]